MLPKPKKYWGRGSLGPRALQSPSRPPVPRSTPGPPVVPWSPQSFPSNSVPLSPCPPFPQSLRLPTPSPPSSTGPVWSGCDTLEICTSGLAKLNHFFPLKSQTEEFAANWYFLMGGPLPSCTRYLASCLLLIYRKSHWICVSPQNLWAKSSSKSLIVCLLQGYDFRQLPDQSNRYLQSYPKS